MYITVRDGTVIIRIMVAHIIMWVEDAGYTRIYTTAGARLVNESVKDVTDAINAVS
jgi:hypothetical protein